MQIPSNILNMINIINSINLYYVFIPLLIIFYFLFALFTWSFLKPLKYIGSVNITTGLMFMSIKLLSTIINSFNINNIIKDILPTIINPLFTSGLISLISGIIMMLIYYIVNKIIKNKKEKVEQEPKLIEEKITPEQIEDTAINITK